jgi:hypothetical protein
VKEGDIVRVVKPHPGMGGVHIDILYEVGWIEKILQVDSVPWAQIHTLALDDSCGGSGGIPLDCLALEPAPEWHAAKARRDAHIEKYLQESLERTRRRKALVAAVAEKHGVSPEVAERIHAELDTD